MKESDADHKESTPTEADPDIALMLAFQRGDEEAFVRLYRCYRDRIVNFARRFLGSSAQGEEAAQEVFLKLYSARARYQPQSRFSTYLFRIATNHCLNQRARHDHKLRDGADGSLIVERQPASSDQEPEELVARAQLQRAVRAAIAKLPAKQAAALLLCNHEGQSYKDAAAALEVSESSVKSLLFRARETLERELGSLKEGADEVNHALP